MKSYWTYTCDFGHTWSYFREDAACEQPSDTLCPEGHEAVTLYKETMLNLAQLAIRPAAKIVDRITGQIGHEYEYYLVVHDVHNDVERMSRKAFSWNEIKDKIDLFRDVSPSKAWEIMEGIDSAM